jgi:hypothetical protein
LLEQQLVNEVFDRLVRHPTENPPDSRLRFCQSSEFLFDACDKRSEFSFVEIPGHIAKVAEEIRNKSEEPSSL